MVQHSRNGGKYLMRKWHEQRQRALRDPSAFSNNELTWLEVERRDVSEHDPQTFVAETTPIDPLTRPRRIDIRDREDR